MDEKKSNESTKITRSQARHIRRKRLIIARRSANLNYPPESSNNSIETHREEIIEKPLISKSKARQLRKKSHRSTSQSSPSPSLDNSEIASINSISTTEEIRSDTEKNSQELLNNEKNRKITESLLKLNPQNTELIINIDSKKIPSTISNISHGLSLSNDSSQSSAPQSNNQSNSSKNIIPKGLKMNADGKTRDEIKAEREAKKAAKAAAKIKSKGANKPTSEAAKPSLQEYKNPSKTNTINRVMPNSSVISEGNSILNNVMLDEEVEKEIPKLNEKFGKMTVSDFAGSPHQMKVLVLDEIIKQEVIHGELIQGKSKAELRAERRVKQQAQRAAKELQQMVGVKPVKAPNAPKVDAKMLEKIEISTRKVKKVIIKESSHEVGLFKHLYHERGQAFVDTPVVNSHVHPAIVRLGVQYASKIIVGSNARCIAFLAAVKELIQDFERPSQADFTRGLESSLQEHSAYLHHCRPMAVTMHNALRHLKWQITQLPSTISDDEAKTKLVTAIDTYIKEQILLAGQAISFAIQTKISNGDVILTCSYSSLIQKILCEAHDKGKKFRVVILDGRPFLEGRELLRRLAKHGIECSYGKITQVSNIITKEGVNKVLLGVHAIFANGAIMSRLGTAQVALMAKAFNIPVLFACETYKTCERVQTDSIVNNEIGDPNELAIGSAALTNWKGQPNLNLLNLTYDVTPPELITAVVTELGILPCTSVPVILRMKSSEI